jgi:hypothetical protein
LKARKEVYGIRPLVGHECRTTAARGRKRMEWKGEKREEVKVDKEGETAKRKE